MKANDWRKLAEMVGAVTAPLGGPVYCALEALSSLMATEAAKLDTEEARTNLTASNAGCVVPPGAKGVWSDELQGWVLPSGAPLASLAPQERTRMKGVSAPPACTCGGPLDCACNWQRLANVSKDSKRKARPKRKG